MAEQNVIHAEQFVDGVRQGLDDSQLMEKYALTQDQLARTFRKFIALGSVIHQEFPLIEAPEQIGLNPRRFDEELHSEGRPCQVLQTGVDSLARLYRLEDEQQVRAFVDRFPFLAVLLLEAHEAISVLFPDSPASLSIHRYHDEIEEEELVVWIHTSLSVDAAMDRLDALAESWWLDNMGRAEGKLGFDLRFS